MKFDRPFYVIDQYPNLNDPKSLRLKNWNNTDIEETSRFLIASDFRELDLFASNYPKTWSMSSCFEMLSQKDNETGGYTIGFCCLDIDDQRLNKDSKIYDRQLDQSSMEIRQRDSFYILNAIYKEFYDTYKIKSEKPLYSWVSNKGLHIIVKLPSKYFKLLGSKKLKFKEEFLRKYNLQDIAKFIDVDLLQQHQIKKPNEGIKYLLGSAVEEPQMLTQKAFNYANENALELPDICVPFKEEKEPEFVDYSEREHSSLNQYSFAKLLRYLNLPIKYVNGNEVKIKCPFHDEKTASMCIDLEKGLYKCFGCGASGNIYQFYAKFRGYDTKRDYKTIKSELDLIAQ